MLSTKLPNSYVLAAYVQTIPRTAALLLCGFVLSTTPGIWPGVWVWILVGPLILAHVVAPLYTRGTYHILVTPDEVSIRTGLFTIHTRTLEWQSVSALDVTSPWGLRLFGLSQVTLGQAGDGATRFEFPALDAATYAEVRRAWDAAKDHDRLPAIAAAELSTHEVIYRSSIVDLLIASIVYGQFALAGGALALSASDLLNSVGLSAVAQSVITVSPVVSALAIAAVVTAGGLVVSAVRLHGFIAIKNREGITIRYGLINTKDRTIHSDAVSGVLLKRNLVESVIGRVRLSLLTRDSATGLGTNLILPSLPHAIVTRVLTETLMQNAPTRYARVSGAQAATCSLVSMLLVAVPPIAVVVWSLYDPSLPRYFHLLFGGALAVVLYSIGWLSTATISLAPDGRAFAVSSPFISEREWHLAPSSIHVLSTVTLGSTPLFSRLHYYAGKPRSAWFARIGMTDLHRLAASASTRDVAQTQPTKRNLEAN
ncbi:PH domain-containing protein [Cryobacterium lyxosi]|uniref:PH domain-containing protein n=1 Tax=Cryobacterium lyxosi TaxID=1259228 RepID=UPI001A7E1042|nr:PH domain-containing protein [Cryobacterium lyxosi]